MSDTYTIDTPFNGGITTDAVPIDPFTGFILTNPDIAAIGTATIVLSAVTNGILSNLTTGTLSPDGSTYTVTGSTAEIQAALRALVFTPTDHQVAPGQAVTTDLALTVSDTASTVTDNADNLILATAVANVPALHVTHPPDIRTDAQTVTPFSGLTVTDPDVGATETATIMLTAGGTATDANGTLSGSGLTKTGAGTYQLAVGTPASVQAVLDALVFTPASLGAQSSVTTDIDLQVANSVGGTTTITVGQTASDTGEGLTYIQGHPVDGSPNEFTSASATTETSTIGEPATQTNNADETTITAVLNGSQIVYQESFALPYSDPAVQAAVTQADLALTAAGAVPATPGLTSSVTTSAPLTIVAAAPSVVTSISVTTNFGPGTLGPFDAEGSLSTKTPNAYLTLVSGQEDTNVNTDMQTTTDLTQSSTITTDLLTQQYTIFGSNDAYVIGGTQAAQATTDAAAIDPFAGVTVSNADTAASGTATVVLSAAANGTLSNLGTGTLSPDGTTYTVSGATGLIQAALRALLFTPADRQTTPGGTETTGFDVTVSDGVSTVTDSTTSVVATAAEDAPVIGGTTYTEIIDEAGVPTVYRTGVQEVAAGQTPVPFAAVTITDPDFGALETSTITLDVGDAKGTLSGTGLTKTGVGTYLLAALSPAAEQAALRLLVFNTPLDSGSVTGFTLQVSDGIAPPVTDTNTIVQMMPPDVTAVQGDPNVFVSTSTTSTTSTDTTPATQTDTTNETTIMAVLNGSQVVYDQTFALPYSDPTVQAAIVQANADLTADGATGGTPTLTSSATTDQGSQTTTVQSGQQTGTPTVALTTNFGPQTVYVGPSTSFPFTLLAGQVDTNVNTDTPVTVDQTATTTTTMLTTQAYTISGSNDVLCFLAGTLIGTPEGQVEVERLAAGDPVRTASGAVRLVLWVGHGRVLATRGRRGPATPVIVRKGALGANVPHTDLFVTKGHAFWFDGLLIPVEFLVNHRSILWDDRAQEVLVYHVELETHDVLVANGAAAESYRDDGNRWLFQNANAGWGLGEKAPCAPVLTGGAVVDAVWRRLLDACGARPSVPLTEEADVHLRVDGVRVEASSRTGDVYVFALPPGVGSVRLMSRTAVPQELGVARDARLLGVAVRRVVVRQGTRFQTVQGDDALLAEGFHAFEPETGLRWTDGDAVLPAVVFDGFPGRCEVVVHLGGTATYVDDGELTAVA